MVMSPSWEHSNPVASGADLVLVKNALSFCVSHKHWTLSERRAQAHSRKPRVRPNPNLNPKYILDILMTDDQLNSRDILAMEG